MLLEAAIREYEEVAGLRSRAVRSATAREEQLFDTLPSEQRLRVRQGLASGHARAKQTRIWPRLSVPRNAPNTLTVQKIMTAHRR